MSRSPGNAKIPTHLGVAASCISLPTLKPPPWPTVLAFLAQRMPAVSSREWTQRFADGLVLSEDGQGLALDTPYQGGARIYYYRELANEQEVPFEESVLYQDDHLVVADKPHFLPVTPGGRYVQQCLLVRLQRKLNMPQLAPLHRIDRETAGLVLFAVNPAERGAYHALFSGREMHKTYEAIAPANSALSWPHTRRSRLVEHPTEFYRMVEAEVGSASNSETVIRVLEQRGPWARYELSPISGKRHQLRVHMNALGLPIVGDQLYPTVLHGPDETEDFAEPLRLLAKAIAFTDPVSGQARRFESTRQLEWPAQS
ncbi:pseudouridine synthase [Hydrogenophaga crassostreae]|uniref:Pseudouridine synthase n=1 Tax=Hydrogenophaga crassostreae TaxID=1763535 RepID=A0A167GZE3_9BURK|nr:pseudouridine synthase [Hydrogenophaga crassostreae]AOW12875.1 pseudouridine synthase [Hydrogenophaga crassostreae]OAD40063.1 pseudouridine synthase [Hydrogenophaga crassostreae]